MLRAFMQTPDSQPAQAVAVGQRLGAYELIREVGSGGMGIVFEARDRERHTTVALKTLHRLSPRALLRLKAEFRGVANVLHPNLVLLHELHSAEGVWFFTMEYVEGQSLASLLLRAAAQVTSRDSSVSGDTPTDSLLEVPAERSPGLEPTATLGPDSPTQALSSAVPPAAGPAPARGPLLDIPQVHHLFGQLAQGICALHRAGKLHCDIKPANVMVARSGRVVLLDFGVVSNSADHATESTLAGTPAYMAPERISGRATTEASDWYSFGTMLYEVLAGHRPFAPTQHLLERVHSDAPPLPASALIPQELSELCLALLRRDPATRPTGAQVLEALQVREGRALLEQATAAAQALVGRESHLAALHDAWRTVLAGSPVTVYVHGRSGMGKSTLVQRFIAGLPQQQPALVVRGRCYERESVPYKGMDDLVDSLAWHLERMPPVELDALLPEDMSALGRVFPVLLQPDVRPGQASPAPADSRDLQEVRRRAFHTLKLLLSRLARQTPLLLHIDDLQWGDADTFTLLHELLAPPEAPRLLLVCSFRSEEASASSFLAEHRRMKQLLGDRFDGREVEVQPLSPPEATELASWLLGDAAGSERAQALARESQGSPFFLEELARQALSTHAPREPVAAPAGAAVSLERLVLERVAQLPEEARRVLEVVSVAGKRLPQGIAARAASLRGDSLSVWMLLRTRSLVRTQGSREADSVECFHDRIRETVYTSLAPQTLRQHHLGLAEGYERAGTADAEVLAEHYQGAGVLERAGHYLTLAAERAASALAFERAAELYRAALECRPEQRELRVKRADALVNTGRCAEAAALYLEAAQHVAEQESFALKQLAAEQYLKSGCLDEGLAVFRPLLEQLGLTYPETPRRALLGLLGRGVQLRLRGTGFRQRPADSLPRHALRRIDLLWAAAKGMGSIDVIRGAYFMLRGMVLSLELGEPRRIHEGLIHTAFTLASPGTPGAVTRAYRQLQQAEDFARQSEDRQLLGFTKTTSAVVDMLVARWQRALKSCEEATTILSQCPGAFWEITVARTAAVTALLWRGSLSTLAVLGPTWLRHTEENGDRYGTVWMRQGMARVLLAADEPDTAEQMVSGSLKDLTERLFTLPHLNGSFEACQVALYRGDAAAAWKRITQVWKAAEDSFTMHWQLARVKGLSIRGEAAVALAAQQPSERKRLLAVAEQDAARLQRLGRPHARGAAAHIRGAVACLRGQPQRALAEFELARSRYEEADMLLGAASALWCQGTLLGGEEGRALVTQAEGAMREQGIVRPERWAARYLPGIRG